MASRSRLFSKIAKDVGSDGNLTAAALSPDVSFGATVYDSTGVLPYVGNDTGDQAYVRSNNRFYIWDSSGWYNVALINRAPTISSVLDSDGASSPFTLSIEGAVTTITITATDSDGDPITYSATADADFNGLATITGSGNEFTITPYSSDSATTESGTITFKATDGINISSSISTFTLVFISEYWDETVLSIGTSNTNGLANSTFIDRSTNAHTVTAPNGNPIQTAFHPYLDNWSVEFDGSGDYITYPDNTDYEFGTEDFTIELFAQFSTSTTTDYTFVTNYAGNLGWGFQWRPNQYPGAPLRLFYNGATNIGTNAFSPEVGKWYHLAVSRNSGTIRVFADGVELASANDTDNYTAGGNLTLGRIGDTAAQYFNGYMSNVRIIKGTALYTANFTPPTEKLTAVTNTVFLSTQSNRFIDNSTNGATPTVNGNPEVSAFNPFGQSEYAVGENKGSVFLDETSSEYIISELTTLDNVDATWTIECWAYPTTDGSPEYVIGFNNKNGGNDYIIGVTASFIVGVSTGAQPINDGQWNHVALTSDGTNVRLFINGVLEETVTYNATKPISACVAAIGVEFDAANGGGPGNYFDGYISDWGVSDTCKYTSNFTPPTSPVSADADVLYVPMDNAGIFDKTGNQTLTLVGNTSTSTTQTKFADTAMYFDGSGDYILSGPNELYDRDFTIELWWYPTSTARQALMHGSWGNDWSIGIDYSSTSSNQKIGIWASSNGSSWNLINSDGGGNGIGSETINQNAWNHIAYTRSGTTWRLFVNGVLDVELTGISGSIARPTQQLAIGAWWSTGSLSQVNGYIENFQILKGVAKYTSNFTPPTQEQGITYQAES